MPELPEVETIKQDLQKTLIGKKILGIWTDSPKQLQPSLPLVEKNTTGTVIEKIKRRAKLLQFYLSNRKILIVHLKLTGRLLIRKTGAPQDEWQHVIFKLKDQRSLRLWDVPYGTSLRSVQAKLKTEELELRFCDLRKFGYIRLVNNEKELEELLSEFGPEPLTAEFTLEKFREILSRFGKPIKLLLMDQAKIAGVGNIYANEALFLAKIAPQKRARDLVQKEPGKVRELYKALERVLKEGIKYRGASDQAYLDAFGEKGEYQEHFRVYQQEGKPCLNKCGATIQRITLGGRGTFFCPKCQTR